MAFHPVVVRPDREEARELRGLHRAAVALEHQLAVARAQFAAECRRLIADRLAGTPKVGADFDYDPESGVFVEKAPTQHGADEPHVAADPTKPELTRAPS